MVLALTPDDVARVIGIINRALENMGISKSGAASGYLVDSRLLCAVNVIQIEKEVSG